MKEHLSPPLLAKSFSRRRFVQGLATGGVLLGASSIIKPAWAETSNAQHGSAPILVGTEFHLTIAESLVNFTGNPRIATTINGSIPAPTLRWKEGDTITIHVTNNLREDTSIHWHGIILPFEMDGVPGISFNGIPPGTTFTYRFKIQQSGTYWYHSHSGMQELTGMYGAIIIDPLENKMQRADREHVVLLSDWMDEDPMMVMNKLRIQSDYNNFHQPTMVDFFRDISDQGLSTAINKRKMWNNMRMSPADLADLSSYTLTYLMNGSTPAGGWRGEFKRGEKICLHFINGSGATFYDVRIPGLKLTVVQADGQPIDPVSVDELRFGPGETYDVIVEPIDDAYTIFAQSMDRSGFARGTLSSHTGAIAMIPALDKVEQLTMGDMMGSMGGTASQMSKEQNSSHDMETMHHGGMAMDHSKHAMQTLSKKTNAPSSQVRHASTEYGPSTDMRVDMPRTNLDDPGVGLRNNGRRVLTLSDLHTIGGAMDVREPEREIELHLTGNMERYTWSLDGLEFGKAAPVHFNYGERLRVILHNDTMMTHPMHMHGMWSELETSAGVFQARRHTIPVQPAQRISFQVTADAKGRWAWHCHLMFHMDFGMFREVLVS